MTVWTHIKLLKTVLKDLKDELDSMGWSLGERFRNHHWDRDGQNQSIAWHQREEVPPPGHLWATDGDAVWIIRSDGQPIPPTAKAVRQWAPFPVPFAPKLPD